MPTAAIHDSQNALDSSENKADDSNDNINNISAEEESAIHRKEMLILKERGIQGMINRQRLVTVASICMIAAVFSSYFVGGYFFSVDPFNSTPDILKTLEMLCIRDVNIEYTIAFERDNEVFNLSIPALEDPTVSGATYYIERSNQRE